MDQAEWKLLKEIADLEKTPQGAYNIRRNGQLDSRNSTANIEITTKTEPGKSGIDIHVKPGTKQYNDFFIGDDCDVDIVAGCGIHNTGCETSQHDGVHTFHIGKNSKVRYVERHYGEGPGTGRRIMNRSPTGSRPPRATWRSSWTGRGPAAGWCPGLWPRTTPSRCSTPR